MTCMKLSDLRAYLSDQSVGRTRKVLLVLAVVYLIVPFDVVPDVIPVFGWLDDVGVLGFAAAMMMSDASRRAVQASGLAAHAPA
jgi:uncharacterized membrane protein YkvA (DUF1232 family)